MIAQHGLGAPLGLTALEFVFAAEARKLGEPNAHLAWAEKLDLFDAHALGEKRPNHPGLVEDFEQRRLKGGPARLLMRRGPFLDGSRPCAVTEELARGKKPRGSCANDE